MGITKAKKRVLIAKDVLKLLGAKKFKPTIGKGYLELTKRVTSKNINSPLEKILKTTKACEVCALGSLFYAHVNRFNEVKISDLNLTGRYDQPIGLNIHAAFSDTTKILNKYFSPEQLTYIENDFEMETIFIGFNLNDLLHLKAKDRLIFIMKNIIENKGTYKAC